ncbi:hypothetical protein CKO44_00055 [Rubrivivax gelatinosus]|uniref:Ribbon-helix-helix CopG family protein n=1 Tax=Rubrivivax gelatinosus TaxID=28068 RepID=A0ABS1DNG0_RUBGE|nr:hypothetical protein [Rubrivivax gelatinosus]MBK1611862.1 hypothetical protein [Rubrivivax gelatinosus]MBK1711519.1 hypothetical protein [Rubrivivax gelatinosus]MBZ8143265.1 hypothetical protein [Rubrivivax gelatinosus]
MSNSSHDFVSVDMRGLKAALVERAARDRVTVSAVVRAAVERHLGPDAAATGPGKPVIAAARQPVKVSIRLTAGEAASLADGARRAGVSRGAYLAALALAPAGAVRGVDGAAALTASCAQLATLARDLRQLRLLLAHGSVEASQAYRQRLDDVERLVRQHLEISADLLAELRPLRRERRDTPQGASHGS